MLLAPPDKVCQVEQPSDDSVDPEEHQNVELTEAIRQPIPELRTIERGRRPG
jgi:hypothetical protein